MAKISIVPRLAAGSVTLDQIPAEFVSEFEQIWKDLTENANTELRVEFDDMDEKKQWMAFAKSYCEQRMAPDGSSDRLKIRATPKRNLPETVTYFSVTRDVEANGNANSNK
jgi:hypothetical protein